MSKPPYFSKGRFWTQEEWADAVRATALKQSIQRANRAYPLAVKQARENEYNGALRQRRRQAVRAMGAAEELN